MNKYPTLIKILDQLRDEAPKDYKNYHVNDSNPEKLNQARSKAFIHLFLKVKCGITDFSERHKLITDGTQDGGIDAFFIDEKNKNLFLIQSKFRTTAKNFQNKSIKADDLIKMEVKRILQGEEKDSNGNDFNKKIREFQNKWYKLGDQAHYKYKVIILGNITHYNDTQIRKLIDFSEYDIFDFEKTYNELLFPLCQGTYYDPEEITITLDLCEKEHPFLKQKITTKYGEYQVRIIFVPVSEIGRFMSKYKNSILTYNPRNFLTLSTNKVNKRIKDSILSSDSNDFAILNNGITLLAESFEISETTGKVNVGQIIMAKPQIINGGQTAYTLSVLYDRYKKDLDVIFKGKEVMLKVIILKDSNDLNIKFIEELSNATNQQSRVKEADRRSNQEIQIELQNKIFEKFGYFYERKKGEFFPGKDSKYITEKFIINRDKFLRSYLAYKGNPSNARRSSSGTLFRKNRFNKIIDNSKNYKKMLFSYLIYKHLSEIGKNNSKGWGMGLRYGRMAIISAVSKIGINEDITPKNIDRIVKDKVIEVKKQWQDFEKWIRGKNENEIYFYEDSFDFDTYYKGKTLDSDITEFFET